MASNEWLVRKLHEQDKKIEALSRGGTGVGHTSLAANESLTVSTDDGEVVLKDGGLDYVSGVVPPVPTAPSLKLGFGTIEVTWDGGFGEDEDGIPVAAPLDLDAIEVHASTDPEEENWGDDTLNGQIKTREGGTVTTGGYDVDDEVFVCLIALAKTGLRSEPSATASLVIEGLDFAQLFNELDAANATIKNAGEVLVTEQGTLDEKLTEVDGTLNDLGQDLAAVEDAQAQLGTDLSDVMTSVDGKNTITWNPSAPSKVSSPGKAVGDTWYRTSGNSIIGFWRWDGTDWVTQLLDKTTIPLIDIGTGTFGALKGTRLEAESVSVDKLIVSPNANLISDSSFSSGGQGWIWQNGEPVPSNTVFTEVPDGPSGVTATVARYTANAADFSAFFSKSWPFWSGTSDPLVGMRNTEVVPGDSFRFVLRARVIQRPASGTGRLRLRGGFNLNGELRQWPILTGDILTSAPLGEWQTVEGVWAHPGGGELRNRLAVGVHSLNASGAIFEVAFVGMYARVGTTLIEDGGITTPKLAADVLEVRNLKATSGQLNEAVINKLFSDVVVAKTAVANEFIGENAILTGAVTAPKITASEELWAKIAEFVKIRAEHIESDAIDGMVITGPNIRTADSGARVQMDSNGVRVFNAENDVRTHLSPDGSTFKGEVEAETLVVNQGAEFKGNNTLAQGAKLTLAAGVTDPTAPPTVQPYWDGLEFTPPNLLNGQLVGLAFDGTNYWTTAGTWYEVSQPSNQVFRINSTTGTVTGFAFPEPGTSERFGVTCIGSELFWLYRNGYKAYVVVTNLSMTKLREWEYQNLGYSATNPLTYKPGIGNDGTNVVIAHANDDGRLIIRTFNKTTGAQIGADISDSNDNTSSDITGVYVGNADWGRKLVTVAKKSTGRLPSFNATTGVYDGAATQFDAAAPSSTGVVYAGGKFRTLDPSGVIHEYADANTGDNSGDWWAGYGWWTDVDNDGLAETSDYQSRMSPHTRFTWPSRAGIKIMGQPIPTGAGYLIPWLAKKTTGPVRTDFHGTGWDYDVGKPVARISALPSNWSNTISPPAVNTFPEGDSSVLESASGTFRVQGDGSGHWGPLTMGRNGIMSGLIVSGSYSAYVDTANTSKKFTVQLPPGRFTKPPVVWVQVSTAIPNLAFAGVVKEEIGTTSFDFWFNRHNTTSTSVTWFAMDSE